MMSRMPDKICAYIDWSGKREWYAFIGEFHELGDVGYIRADIVAAKDAELTRLSDIISALSDKLTDAEQVRDETLVLNDGEVLWKCDGCGAHGVVPADWKWVPGWDWDEVKRDGRWYCMSCQEKKWWLAAEVSANNKHAIWWLSQRSTEYLYKNHEHDSEELIICLPTAVASEVRSRRGRAGRGRLWGAAVNHEMGNIEWPEGHAVAKIIEDESCGGIVIEWGDVPVVIGLPGFVTDAELNLVRWPPRTEEREG